MPSLSVDGQELDKAVEADTKMLWVETPTNPMLRLVDLAAQNAEQALKLFSTIVHTRPRASRPFSSSTRLRGSSGSFGVNR